MPPTIKTLLLDAIGDAITSVVGIQSAVRNPPTPMEKETRKHPYANVYDEVETIIEKNRITTCTFPLQVDVWIREDKSTASATADTFQAEIYRTLTRRESAALKLYAMHIYTDPSGFSEKDWIDEFQLAIVMRFMVTYSHVEGDPYTLAKNP